MNPFTIRCQQAVEQIRRPGEVVFIAICRERDARTMTGGNYGHGSSQDVIDMVCGFLESQDPSIQRYALKRIGDALGRSQN